LGIEAGLPGGVPGLVSRGEDCAGQQALGVREVERAAKLARPGALDRGESVDQDELPAQVVVAADTE
jgi:hypothetical protein